MIELEGRDDDDDLVTLDTTVKHKILQIKYLLVY